MEIKNKFKDSNAKVPGFTLGSIKPEEIAGVIFLDRDGIVIENVNRDGAVGSARHVYEVKLVKNIELLISRLNKINVITVIVTNQPDVARGKIDEQHVRLINDYLCNNLEITLIVWCPHDVNDRCSCRKPQNGMLKFAINKLKINKGIKQILIGDRKTDILCALRSNIVSYHLSNDLNCKCTAILHFKNFDEKMIDTILENFNL